MLGFSVLSGISHFFSSTHPPEKAATKKAGKAVEKEVHFLPRKTPIISGAKGAQNLAFKALDGERGPPRNYKDWRGKKRKKNAAYLGALKSSLIVLKASENKTSLTVSIGL